MNRMRSFNFPHINTSKRHENMAADLGSPYQNSPTHSRESSAASTTSSPITPTFSARGHNRWPSSSSSLVTSPDSPAATPTSKSPLGDLVEDPSERDDSFDGLRSTDEPLCICDTPWCEHRQDSGSQHSIPLPTPEWSPGDDYFSDGQLPGRSAKRRRSGEYSTDSLSSRLSRHFPSIRKRLSDHRSAFSVSSTNLRSAPSSRPSSLRLPTTRSVTAPATPDLRNTLMQTLPPPAVHYAPRSVSPPRSRAVSSAKTPRPMEIDVPAGQDESHHEFASTPLLPPMMADYYNDSSEAVQSPLQSPSVATQSAAASLFSTPVGTPVIPGFPTPPLSAKASMSSLRNARSAQPLHASIEIPPLTIAEEIESPDPWATKLGHANFDIEPVPYFPEVCDAQTCKQLTEDWEYARKQYMQRAGRVRNDYGPTSQTFKLTEQKWAEIDAAWRANHEMANAEAQATGDSPTFQPLAETMPIAKLPSLNDPQQPGKYPAVEDKDIVGPMVTYAKIQHDHLPTRKSSTILKLFTDPASLLGRRSNVSVRR